MLLAHPKEKKEAYASDSDSDSDSYEFEIDSSDEVATYLKKRG
jgi:hypothetical protein